MRPVGGSGIELRRLNDLPIPKDTDHNIVMDTRSFHISHLSKVQWQWFLVEPGKTGLLKETINPGKESELSEFLAIHLLDDTTPWIATHFFRIKDENPVWYQGL